MIRTGPCNWPVQLQNSQLSVFDKLDQGQSFVEGAADNLSDIVKAAAVQYLWNWTGRRFGPCPVTVDLCLSGCAPVAGSVRSEGGVVRSLVGSLCGPRCSCNKDCGMAKLPGPVHTVEQVLIDGEPFTDFTVLNDAYLTRTDGKPWPQCGEGSLVVYYERGLPVPEGGIIAASVLAVEMAKAIVGDTSCQLPQRVQTITRQGVTLAMLDAGEGLDNGRTGIWVVDNWVASVRQQTSGARVFSPDRTPPGQNRRVKGL